MELLYAEIPVEGNVGKKNNEEEMTKDSTRVEPMLSGSLSMFYTTAPSSSDLKVDSCT